MTGILFCVAVLLSGISIILFGVSQQISFFVKEDYGFDHHDMHRQKTAMLILTISYVILLVANVAWAAVFFFM